MINALQYLITIGLLLIMSIQDMKKKQISLWLLLLMAAYAVLTVCMEFWMTVHWGIFTKALTGLLPGGLMLLAGKITRGALGEGDGYITAALGMQIGILSVLQCLLYGGMLAGLCSGILLLSGKCKKKDTIPFLPFLTAGYGIFLGLSVLNH